jgi:trigger factor
MEIVSKSNDGLKWCYNVFLPREDVDAAMAAKLEEKAKTVRLDGFRPGKVPLEMVKRLHGDAIRKSVINDLVTNTANAIIKDEQLNICLNCITNIIKNEEFGVEFTMKFDLMPKVELKDFSFIEVIKYQAEITDQDVLDALEEIRSVHKKWTDVNPEQDAQIGHKVVVDLEFKLPHNKKTKSEVAKNIDIFIGGEDAIDDFWKPLVGAKLHEVREFIVNYPDDMKDKSLAGHSVTCIATIHKIMSSSEYHMDDEFAKYIGYDDFEKAKEWARSAVSAKYEKMTKDIMHRELLEKLSDMYNELLIPESILEYEYKDVYTQIAQEAQRLGKAMTPKIIEETKKLATRRAQVGFVIADIAKLEGIKATNDEIIEAISNIARLYPGHEKSIFDMYTRGNNINIVVGPILESKVIDWILKIVQLK